MALPMVDILEGSNERKEFISGFDGAWDVWGKDIETYAPGYLKMEEEDREADYDHVWLANPDDAFNVH